MIILKRTKADEAALQEIAIDPDDLKDDGTDYLEKRIKKPWGHEIEKFNNGSVSVWWLHIHSWQQTSMHCHPSKDTVLFVVAGEAVLSTLSYNHEVGAGDLVVIAKGVFHRMTAKASACVLYELETPINKRDLVRLEDSYGRGQGYEKCESTTP